MNVITGMVLLGLSLGPFGQQASAHNNCLDVKGSLVEIFAGGNTATGTLTHGGLLNGTTISVFSSGAYPTPDPDEVTLSSSFTLTTTQGQLKASGRVYLFDFVKGQGVSILKIDPLASTGIFSGATGVLFTADLIGSAGPPPNTYYDWIGGTVCFVK